MTHEDLPLFAWQPPRKTIVFPMKSRIGRIRDVAAKMVDKQTQRHADHYFRQVNEAMVNQLSRIGLSELEIDEQVGAFWVAVDQEITRLVYQRTGGYPGGAA